MREIADHTAADCTTVNELILDTTDSKIYKCTVTGTPGTWVSTAGSVSLDFENIYTTDADKTLTTSNGAFTIAAGSGAVAVNGTGGISLNNNTNGATNINTGTSTGDVSIGGGSGTVSVNSTSWDISSAGVASGLTGITSSGTVSFTGGMSASGGTVNLNNSSNNAVNIGTGTSTGAVAVGGGSNTVSIDSSTWDISSAGVASGLTGITSTGTINLSGASRFALAQSAGTPATCTVGDLVYNTSDNKVYACTATNTWTVSGPANFENVYAYDSDKTLTTSNGAFTIAAGSGAVTVNSTNAGGISLNAGTNGPVNIGTGTSTGTITLGGTGTQTIDIGDGAGSKTVGLGSTNTTSTTTINSGSGGLLINASNSQPTYINTGTSTGSVNVGTGSSTQTLSFGTGAGVKTVGLGSTNSTSTTNVNSGSGGVNINANNNQPTYINTGTSTGIVDIGNSTGKVGVGTASPQHMLDVNGSLYSRRYTVTDPGTGTIAIDWNNGNTQSVTITGTGRTITFANGQDGGKYVLIVKQDTTGSRTITTWPTAVRWPTGGAITLTTTASKSDYIGFIYNGVDSKYDAVAFMTNL